MSSHDELVRKALEPRKSAYAPYSGYSVGAAIAGSDGRVFAGTNVENAAYGLAICAERSAVVAAVLAGVRACEAIAVATSSSPPAAPCGMCLQTLAEFAQDLPIILVNESGEKRQESLGSLLPRAFRNRDLPQLK